MTLSSSKLFLSLEGGGTAGKKFSGTLTATIKTVITAAVPTRELCWLRVCHLQHCELSFRGFGVLVFNNIDWL